MGSNGALFILMADDGKADRLLLASEMLNQRLMAITCRRKQMGYPDPTPTLVDIERTHILYVNAHFKPFVAIAYEYMKINPQNGTAGFAQDVTFSIPQFGDFFSDMVLHLTLSSVTATTGTVPAFPADIGAINEAPGQSATNDVVNLIFTRYTYTYVDIAGNTVATGSARANYVRYAEYPGERLCRITKFNVNNNPLDEYTTEALFFFRKFRIAPGKLVGYQKLIGQEVPKEGYSDLCTISGASQYNALASNLTQNVGGAAAPVAPVNATTTSRVLARVVDGPQTPKATQPALDLWIPLIFWFCLDVRLAVASVSIPYGQRFLTFTFDQQANILFTAPGNLWLQLRTELVSNSTGTSAGTTISNYRAFVTREPVLASNSTIGTQTITLIELFINNIFLSPEIHDIYIKRIGFSLIRVHRLYTQEKTESQASMRMDPFKWPTETIYLGLRPTINVSSANTNQWRDWHRLNRLTDNTCYRVAPTQSLLGTTNADPTLLTIATVGRQSGQFQVDRTVFPTYTDTINTLRVVAHGIPLYDTYPRIFYNAYLPYRYGGYNIITPDDDGALMVNFCFFPGTYQPSSHINISRAREFFIEYVSSYVSASTTATFIALAIALNFLLISDGSAVLRYST